MNEAEILPISFTIEHEGDSFGMPSNGHKMLCIPRIGESVFIPDFFPDYDAERWETRHGIPAFGKVVDIAFYLNKIEMTVTT